MNPAHQAGMVLFAVLVSAVNSFGLYILERSLQRRLDDHAERLALLEYRLGFAPQFPLDVACPICGAEVREPCRGARGATHATRFDFSPGAKRARRAT